MALYSWPMLQFVNHIQYPLKSFGFDTMKANEEVLNIHMAGGSSLS